MSLTSSDSNTVALIKEEKKRCVPASLPVQYLPLFFFHCAKARNPVIPQMPCPIFTVHCHHWFWGVEDYSHLGDVLVTWLQNLLIIDPFVSVPPFSLEKLLCNVSRFSFQMFCVSIYGLKKTWAYKAADGVQATVNHFASIDWEWFKQPGSLQPAEQSLVSTVPIHCLRDECRKWKELLCVLFVPATSWPQCQGLAGS